jgi:hypothetical protein
MSKAFVKVEVVNGGRFLPTMYFPTTDGFGDREAYFASFPNLFYAEEHAKIWASEHKVEYKEFVPYTVKADSQMIDLIKRYKAEGMEVADAIRRARSEVAASA